jgi:hypothetical protein
MWEGEIYNMFKQMLFLKSSITNQGLKRHMIDHTGDYPYKCQQFSEVWPYNYMLLKTTCNFSSAYFYLKIRLILLLIDEIFLFTLILFLALQSLIYI